MPFLKKGRIHFVIPCFYTTFAAANIRNIKTMNEDNKYYLPPEWAEQECVQLTWPHRDTDWKPILDRITDTYVEMAVEIARREPLLIVAPHPEEALEAIRRKVTAALPHRIDTFACDTNDTWARDHGFITLIDGKGHARRLDFCFNGWGEKFAADKDNAINRRLAESGILDGDYEDHLDFVLEGGSIESDGQGTVFTTTGCLMAPHRNQPLTRNDIEQRLKLSLRAERVVWIDHGNLTGDDTDGHIDTLVRVAPNDTLLYVGCDDSHDTDYEELHLMELQLQQLQTTDGKPYRLLRLPSPRPIIHDGERLPATYANFLVINGAVLYPTYRQPDTDREAARIIAQAFPDREIVGIDSSDIIIQHGALHCCTMQYPQSK